MPRDNYQKVKLLYIHELLKQEADIDHPLTTREICERLSEDDIPCDRRTLTKDIAMLRTMGFEIYSVNIGHEKAYYITERAFSLPELKILIDAVRAASFITPQSSTQLIEKLATLGGAHKFQLLKHNLVCFNTRKHTNDAVLNNIETLEGAIEQRKKVSFFYFDLNEFGEKVYRKAKKRYVVDPSALIYHEDNYYLMSYSKKHGKICNYRVDRMIDVTMEEEDVPPEAVLADSDTDEYTKQVFKMYGGDVCDCALEFDNKLIGIIYDKFGESTKMMRLNDERCIATVKIQVSPTFWGWIFQFVGEMRLISPKPLADEYKARAQKILDT